MKKYIFSLLTISLNIATLLNSCMVTFINDGNQPAMIYDFNDVNNKNNQLPTIFAGVPPRGKGEKGYRFGSSTTHAHFAIYLKHPKKRTYDLSYEVTQNQC